MFYILSLSRLHLQPDIICCILPKNCRVKLLIICFLSLLFCFSLHAQSTADSVYTQVDSAASFKGGNKAWLKFLLKNLRYPQAAQDNEIQGTIVLKFLVGTDGMVSDVTAISGPPELREEGIRIIELSRVWIPAIKDGQNVKSYMIKPLTFRLERH